MHLQKMGPTRRERRLAAAPRARLLTRATRDPISCLRLVVREGDWSVANVTTADSAPLGGDDRADRRRQDGDQRLKLRRRTSMADFEDANTWPQLTLLTNCIDAVMHAQLAKPGRWPDGTSSMTGPRATLLVRPRGWHLEEKHVEVDGSADVGQPVRFWRVFVPQRAAAARQPECRIDLP